MNEFIIDLNYISLENDNNQMKYYLDNFLIPINSIYKFYYKPYYKNNPYKFRDFHTEDGFIKLLNNKLEEKPRSSKIYNMGTYYITNKDKGPFLKNEIIPLKVNKYNIINTRYYIKEIYTFSKYINISLYKKLYINNKKINNIRKKQSHIKFIIDDIIKYKDLRYIRWIPINNVYIDNPHYYEIDISDFLYKLDVNNINKNLIIVCIKNP